MGPDPQARHDWDRDRARARQMIHCALSILIEDHALPFGAASAMLESACDAAIGAAEQLMEREGRAPFDAPAGAHRWAFLTLAVGVAGPTRRHHPTFRLPENAVNLAPDPMGVRFVSGAPGEPVRRVL